MKNFILIVLFTSLLIAPYNVSNAATEAIGGSKDRRIKTFNYHDEDVYRFKGHYGFSTVIEFSPKETVDSVSIGDSEAWQVVNSNKKNILFVKPLLRNAYTNMTVLTSKRMYSFEMSAGKATSNRSSELAFRIKFKYPEDRNKQKKTLVKKYDPFLDRNSSDFNFKYSYAGSNSLKPIRVFDDGKHTYMRFKSMNSMPAVFAVNKGGNEELINFTIKDDYMVIPRIKSQLTLRDGDIATCIFNDLLQKKDTIQKTPTSVDKTFTKEVAIPHPKEKPYFASKNRDGFFGIFFNESAYKNSEVRRNSE